MAKETDPLTSLGTAFPRQLPGRASRVLHVLDQLQTFQRMPAARQDALLGAQINHLLRHAKRHSPFWRERLAEWTPRRQPPAETLKEIAPLTRQELQNEFERIRADFPERAALGKSETYTSGSTGTPVKVERASLLYNSIYGAVTLLTFQWHGMDQRKVLGIIGSKTKDVDTAPLGTPFRWVGKVGVGFQRSTLDRDVSETYVYCASKKPAYLQCGPQNAIALAYHALTNDRRELRLEKILAYGSAVTAEMRDVVRRALGAEIIDRYSCEETGYIAIQCPKHEHLHVISPATLVEIVDEEGRSCPPGKPGRVLLTCVQSYAMPLIRYDIGDMAEWGEPCDCGITLPVIEKLWGRTRQMITTPDGKRTFAQIYAHNFVGVPGLVEYRFILHQNSVVSAQIKADNPSPEMSAKITEIVQRALSYAYPVQIRYVDKLDWGSSWKQENFAVSDLPPP